MILLVLFLFIQCSSGHKEEQLMKEAAIIHNEMVAQAEALEERLNGLSTDNSFPFSDSIHVWKSDLALWESELVEVPGNEEHHHKEGEHHHDHQQLNVTAAQMMVIQLELQRCLYVIVKRIDRADSSRK